MIEIMDGVPGGMVAIYWYKDYRKFGVSMQQLYDVTKKERVGVQFRKGEKVKSIILSGNTTMKQARQKFLEIEKEFGIPLEASKYK